MRLMTVISRRRSSCLSGPSFTQGWIEYASRADFFSIIFPAKPKVRDVTYPTEYGVTLPGRIHS